MQKDKATVKRAPVKWPPVEPISLTLVRHGECGGKDLPDGLKPFALSTIF